MLRNSFLTLMLLGSTNLLAHEQAKHLSEHEQFKSLIEQERQQRQNVVRIEAPDESTYVKALISLHSELLAADKEKLSLVVDVSDAQLTDLQALGFKSEVATKWLAQRDAQLERLAAKKQKQAPQSTSVSTIPGFPCYTTVEGTFAEVEALAAQYPQLVELVDIGDTWEKTQGSGGYDLWVMKLTNKSITKDKPKMFLHSAMHAREYTPAALTLDFASDILTKYDTNADAHWILNENELHILIHMNPDGRKIAEGGILWRKNNNNAHCPQQRPGVDLNRNFTHTWAATEVGSSGEACDDTYRGPSPASEPETAAVEEYVRSMFPDRRGPQETDAAPDDTSGMYIDVHSFSQLILWPWGHTGTQAPNGAALEMLGRKIAFFNGYLPTQAIGLYPTDGTSFDIGYGELGVASIAYELGTEFFQECPVYTSRVRPQNMASLYYASRVLAAPYRLPFGPDITNIEQQASTDSSVTLSLLAIDSRFNNSSGGSLQAQIITEVEYYVNELPSEATNAGTGLTAADGLFNSISEEVEATIDTSNLEDGQHIVYFRAKNAQDNWGPVYARFIEVGGTTQQNVAPSPDIQTDCTDLVCQLDASQSSDDGSIVTYQWRISDDTELEGISVSHTFAAAGSYEVTLTVVDDQGAEANTSQSVTVTEPAAPPTPPAPPPAQPDPTPPTPQPVDSGSGGGSLSFSVVLLLLLSVGRKVLFREK